MVGADNTEIYFSAKMLYTGFEDISSKIRSRNNKILLSLSAEDVAEKMKEATVPRMSCS